MVTIIYNKNSLNDTMIISISPLSVNRTEKKDKGVLLYRDDELVGINIFEVSKNLDVDSGYLFLTKKVDEFVINNFGVDLKKYHSQKFVVGQIINLEKIPDSHLTKCIVKYADDKETQVVCGGKNLELNAKIVLALPYVIMPNGKIITPSKLMGFESNGMICSRKELYNKDFEEDLPGYILKLNDNYKIGQEYIEHYKNFKNK